MVQHRGSVRALIGVGVYVGKQQVAELASNAPIGTIPDKGLLVAVHGIDRGTYALREEHGG
ncbi:MAG TPA: hypothetical protein PLN42_10765 [Anaerolineae bacterium]|nr:hypothetical protein [Anaerolineae bacterium]